MGNQSDDKQNANRVAEAAYAMTLVPRSRIIFVSVLIISLTNRVAQVRKHVCPQIP